jgi:uncharacterized protein
MAASGELRDAPAAARYEYRIGATLAYVNYQRAAGVTTLTYAKVPEEFEGQGIGAAMVRAVLEDVRARGERVVPLC